MASVFTKKTTFRWFALLFFIASPSNEFAAGIEQAHLYRKNSNLQWEWAITSITNYPWTGHERVLDIGSGDGRITAEICKKLPLGMVIGIDISPKMVDLASKSFKPDEHHNLLFMQGKAQALPFCEQFDVIVSFCTLHWVLDQKEALKGIQKSLLPGGKTLLVFPAASLGNISTQSEHLIQSEKWKKYFPSFHPERIYFDATAYDILLKEIGLIPLSLKLTNSETTYGNQQELIDWLTPVVTFIHHLPPPLQEEFLQDLAQQMVQASPYKEDGKLTIHLLKMEVLAMKPLDSSSS